MPFVVAVLNGTTLNVHWSLESGNIPVWSPPSDRALASSDFLSNFAASLETYEIWPYACYSLQVSATGGATSEYTATFDFTRVPDIE